MRGDKKKTTAAKSRASQGSSAQPSFLSASALTQHSQVLDYAALGFWPSPLHKDDQDSETEASTSDASNELHVDFGSPPSDIEGDHTGPDVVEAEVMQWDETEPRQQDTADWMDEDNAVSALGLDLSPSPASPKRSTRAERGTTSPAVPSFLGKEKSASTDGQLQAPPSTDGQPRRRSARLQSQASPIPEGSGSKEAAEDDMPMESPASTSPSDLKDAGPKTPRGEMATTSTQTAPAKEGEDNTASASHNPVVEEGALQKRIQSDIQRRISIQEQSRQRLGALLQRQKEQPRPMPQSVEGSGSIDLTAPAPQQATANPPDAETLPKKPQNIFLATRAAIRETVRTKGHFTGLQSSLTTAEQRRFIELQDINMLYGKQQRGEPMSEEHALEWRALAARVARETQDYKQAEKNWAAAHSSLYNALLPEFADWIENSLEAKRKAALSTYDPLYELAGTIVTEASVMVGNVELKPVSIVQSMGNVLCVREDMLAGQFPLDPEFCPIAEIAEDVRQTGKNRRWRKTRIPVLSRDERALELARNNNVDVVMSASALEALFCNMGSGSPDQWEIPFMIQRVASAENGERTIVVIDKPLPKKLMSAKEKNAAILKQSIKSMILAPVLPCIELGENKNEQRPQQTVRDRMKMREKTVVQIGSQDVDLTDENITYALWTLGDLRLLVRLKICGYLPALPQRAQRMVQLLVKPEYMPTYSDTAGPEEKPMGERLRYWIHTQLRPQALLLLGCVDMLNSTARIDTMDILQEGRSMESLQALIAKQHRSLYHTLQAMRSYETGRYLLTRELGDASVMKVYKLVGDVQDTHTQGAYDIRLEHKEATGTDLLTKCWLHSVHNRNIIPPDRIPYVFPAMPEAMPVTMAVKKLPPGSCCYQFAHAGFCLKGQQCPFPHVTGVEVLRQVSQIAQPTKSSSKGRKRKKGGGEGAAGMAQGYYHRIDLDDPGLTIAPRVSRASSSGASNVPEH